MGAPGRLPDHVINLKSGTILDPTIRLRLATRIHFALRRNYGEDVEVSTLLRGLPEAREALWVCAASGDTELVSLAQQFAEATTAAALADDGAATLAPAGWRQRMNWLRSQF